MISHPVVGMLVGSNVRLKHLLGSGGMGSVWVAEHLGLEVDVAVKFLSPELCSHAEARARFEREAAAAAQLRSPHVVQIFDRGVTPEGLPYIVMELLSGEDFSQHIERLGPLPVERVVAVVCQVARALSSAHARGIVHRDIKPDNVFLIDGDEVPFVKLLDFGVAKRAQDTALNMTSAHIMMGTPHFMSPEQVLSPRDVDFRADLWSVAVLTYTALTSKLPFDGETIGALCVAISSGSFEPVTRFRADLPAAVDDWFARAFQRDPNARFPSIQEMAAALELATGVSGPRTASSPSLSGVRGDSLRPVAASIPAPFELAQGSQGQTFFEASVTRGGTRTKTRWGLLAAVVAVSMLCSALTTVLVVAPASVETLFQPLSGGPARPTTVHTPPELSPPAPLQPPREADAAAETPLVTPVLPSAAPEASAGEPERQAGSTSNPPRSRKMPPRRAVPPKRGPTADMHSDEDEAADDASSDEAARDAAAERHQGPDYGF